jgi:hypothetical protein
VEQQDPPKYWYPTATLHGVKPEDLLDLSLRRRENLKISLNQKSPIILFCGGGGLNTVGNLYFRQAVIVTASVTRVNQLHYVS